MAKNGKKPKGKTGTGDKIKRIADESKKNRLPFDMLDRSIKYNLGKLSKGYEPLDATQNLEKFMKEMKEAEEQFKRYMQQSFNRGQQHFYVPSTQPQILKKSGDKTLPKKEINPGEILAPLNEVFLAPELMDDLIVRTSVPQLLQRKAPLFPGVILYGPPGTGKSELQRALIKVYQNAGAYAKQVSTTEINSCFVSLLASNLERQIKEALSEAQVSGLPSLLCFDEGSIIAQNASEGSSSVAKHYQEAIDVMKRYLGNEAGKYLVLAISTNLLSQSFEDALVRDGRLTPFKIDFPSKREIAKMWAYFLNKNNIMQLDGEQAASLAELTERESGALIATFAQAYPDFVRQNALRSIGFDTLFQALSSGVNLDDERLNPVYDFGRLKENITAYLYQRRARNGQSSQRTIGFQAS
jgi:SpoVK/Ycf46/Vps4 family AAA+-type ATPase